jgi:predicted dehydrogenase
MRTLNVAMIGSGFMGKAHALAYANMPVHFHPAPAIPVRKVVVDVTDDIAAAAAERLGFEESSSDWRAVVQRDDIDIVDICTPNDAHAEIAIAAATAGKHIICEKPLARTAEEAAKMLAAVEAAGVTHAVAYNYRYTPAIRMAKRLLEDGRLGDVLAFRGQYEQSWSADPSGPASWRFSKKTAGSGALGDIGTHVIDTARYLLGDIAAVSSLLTTHIAQRPASSSTFDALAAGAADSGSTMVPVDVDDAVYSLLRFRSGVVGTLEATRNAYGRQNRLGFEIQGTKGTVVFDYDRLGELSIMFADDPADVQGFRAVQTGPAHPDGGNLWPIPGFGVGYLEVKTIECHEFIRAIVEGRPAEPDFRDGYEIELIAEAMARSSESQRWEEVHP